jgi:diguanylate cyclase (GGDEF)-like protein
MKILVVEDDELVAQALTTMLSHHHYVVETASNGETALELIDAFDYDCVVLDVVLPKWDGIQVCQLARSRGHQMPILLLTGRDSSHDKAVGLDAGADDYMVKPFDEEELVARIRALLRRSGSTAQPLLEWGDLKLDPSTCEVVYGKKLLNLTPKEYALLELFLRNSRRVFSCGAILEHLWIYEEAPGEEAVRTHIKGLRQKLKAAGATSDFIETVYGIGYRLRAIETATKSVDSQILLSSSIEQETRAKLTGVWQRFQGRVSEQVAQIEQASTALSQSQLQAELQQQAKQQAHSLAGSLGTFGFPEGSRLAREIERLLDRALTSKDRKSLQKLVLALRQEIEQPPAPSPVKLVTEEASALSRLLMVTTDAGVIEPLKQDAAEWGFQVTVSSVLQDATQKIEQNPPDLVLLDLDCGASIEESLNLLTLCNTHIPSIAVLVLMQQNCLRDRLEIARRGGRILSQKPISATQVFEAATQLLEQSTPGRAKILIVDDDPSILMTLKLLLEPWGLKVTTLADAKRFWDVLETSSPDLLILDVEFPDLNGIELCQVVRNDLRWNSLPILFLTAHTDSQTVTQVFSAGADDFVSKPIVEPELVARIMNRIERMKLLKHFAETDPLTGVANRYKSSQDLEAFLRSADRYQQSVAIAVLDLDQLRSVNENFDYATGDRVLRQFGQRLRQFFCENDVVARWGGEEFVIGMYGMTRAEGTQRLRAFSQSLDRRTFTTPEGKPLEITFTTGVAQYPTEGIDLQALYRSALGALRSAKQAKGVRG